MSIDFYNPWISAFVFGLKWFQLKHLYFHPILQSNGYGPFLYLQATSTQ